MPLRNTLKHGGAIRTIRRGFAHISPHRRVQMIIVGMTAGFDKVAVTAQPDAHGLKWEAFYGVATSEVAMIHGAVGLLMPILMVMMVTRFFGANRSWTEGLTSIALALFAATAFSIPRILTCVFLGPEFSWLIGALAALGPRRDGQAQGPFVAQGHLGLRSAGAVAFAIDRRSGDQDRKADRLGADLGGDG